MIITSVYIVEPTDHGWIIERLMRDLAEEFIAKGVATRIGPHDGYDGEQVILNSRYLNPFADGRATINALFITHVDDGIKESFVRMAFDKYQSFVCLSPHDGNFIAALKGDSCGVLGLDLPPRNLTVRPTRLALFSARYEDGRKNERWLLDYFDSRPRAVRDNFTLCFMGWGWESFCAELGALEMNYEIYRYSRFLPGEYDLYRQTLAGMDRLIYLGFDGGAMSVYDAISAGISVIAPDASFHRGLGEAVDLFADREGFFRILDGLASVVQQRKDALAARSIQNYTVKLLQHWGELVVGDAAPEPPGPVDASVVEEFRANYGRIGRERLRSAAIRFLQNWRARLSRRGYASTAPKRH
jgi:hypothetical protein